MIGGGRGIGKIAKLIMMIVQGHFVLLQLGIIGAGTGRLGLGQGLGIEGCGCRLGFGCGHRGGGIAR